ncbi:B-4DMT family transporter [Actinophytocola gossypii]|uniref:B-4DMT family transporter n=1 Tax=Actinophytocola gossypii TaxID=2812003 RepID=A0ABT2J5U9_9PSEU|nr:B-4DMT family transporter [Actinophytocola gossypii]MCT2583235.1 B-4DMT family transporter [Actinophytocola gossypii]
MRTWLLRGAVLAVVHAAAETARADFGVHHPTSRTVFEAVMLGVLVGVAAVWSALDTWRDVPDRGRAWLIAALVAGWVAGVLSTVGKSVFVDQTGVADLGAALTGGAAFTALLVVVPAGVGLLAGRWIGRPRATDDAEVS